MVKIVTHKRIRFIKIQIGSGNSLRVALNWGLCNRGVLTRETSLSDFEFKNLKIFKILRAVPVVLKELKIQKDIWFAKFKIPRFLEDSIVNLRGEDSSHWLWECLLKSFELKIF